MSKRVPDFINPFRAAEGGHSIAGRLAFARMGRLIEVVENTEGAAEVSLDFAIDDQGIAHVRGRVRAEAVLICQRCLEPMTVSIDAEINLGIVGSDDEAKRLPEQYEPLVVSGQQLSVAELIEDELLLFLPAIPRHDDAVCAEASVVAMKERDGEGDFAETSTNPFAVLARLKSKQ
jgi:uncharacterized protein